MKLVIIYLVLINAVAFAAFGIDKYKARARKWRTPEATLLALAAAGGSAGAWLGMQLFRHKTRHLKFTVGVPAILALQLALAWWLGR